MEFKCTNCGKDVDSVTMNGYIVGHMTKKLNERDLEGVKFELKGGLRES